MAAGIGKSYFLKLSGVSFYELADDYVPADGENVNEKDEDMLERVEIGLPQSHWL